MKKILLTGTLAILLMPISLILNGQTHASDQNAVAGKRVDSTTCEPFVYGGQTYHTTLIGSQCWMIENLNIGKWVNAVQSQKISDSGIIEKYCFGNNFVQCDYWGGLYQWAEVMRFTKDAGTRGICPDGWHVPSSRDWKSLIRFLGTEDDAGGKLKSTLQWQRPNVGASNSSGFSAYPGGAFDFLSNKWYDLNLEGYYWTSEIITETTAVGVNLTFRTSGINMYEEFQTTALSVRCIKD